MLVLIRNQSSLRSMLSKLLIFKIKVYDLAAETVFNEGYEHYKEHKLTFYYLKLWLKSDSGEIKNEFL